MSFHVRALSLLAVFLCACQPADPVVAREAFEIVDARARIMGDMGVVYLSIHNATGRGDRLLRVDSPAARHAQLHETRDDQGVMRMRAMPDGAEIPPGGRLELEPGGKHIMLIEPQLAMGATRISLTLHLEHAAAIEIDVPLEAM